MKVVLLAGGMGTRLSEETVVRPKPMVEIGGKPILWHIMKMYSHYGFHDFIICLGYKGYMIKEYFANYFLHTSDVTFDIVHNRMEVHQKYAEPWKVTLVDTGDQTMTGGRVKRIQSYVNGEPFLLTYGDGVADLNIAQLLAFHRAHRKHVTVTATQPIGRFGALTLERDNVVKSFMEKPIGDGGWINGGFFVMQPEVFRYIADDSTTLERDPMEKLAGEGELVAFKHYGFWQAMDTLRDKNHLEDLWASNKAPWKL
ncbi:MAG: glucose-1-phosphate cytidylyltransferase, partial [Nitrospirota bacterium]|nr:glucose-1-phosphate cytidylyltransferase [Nitrospirota bacterium]